MADFRRGDLTWKRVFAVQTHIDDLQFVDIKKPPDNAGGESRVLLDELLGQGHFNGVAILIEYIQTSIRHIS